MSNQFILTRLEDKIATLTINNPPVNALSRRVMEELDKTLDELGMAKVVVITGAGSFFSAGADIKELAGITSLEEAERVSLWYNDTLRRLEISERPIIAAINGHCLGGGLELAMACHFRLASETARLGHPEINLGIIPGAGGTQRLPRLVGRAKAVEMLLTGEPLSAQEAKACGLVSHVTKQELLLEEVKFLAKRLCAKPGVAVSLILEALKGMAMSLEEALALEARLFGHAFTTEDSKEGLKAFLEKRTPHFKDK